MKKSLYIVIGIFLIGSVIGGIMTRCTTDAVTDCPQCMVLERTDIAITGALNAEDFNTSLQDDATRDLVSYNFYGHGSDQIDFKVQLQTGEQIVISIVDKEAFSPWLQVGKAYNIYPAEDIEDKLSYATVEYLNKEGGVAYATNTNTSVPGIQLEAFSVTVFDGVQMQCRMRDMTLQKTGNEDAVIHINGTFVGAVDF